MMLTVCLCLFIGVCLGVEVHQSPPQLLVKVGEEAQLVCSHQRGDYRVMQWYQQSPGESALKRIGHLSYDDKEYEDPFKDHFRFVGDLSGSSNKNASMFITKIKPEHSAVYYCAASYAQRSQTLPHTFNNTLPFFIGVVFVALYLHHFRFKPVVSNSQYQRRQCHIRGRSKMISLTFFSFLTGACLSLEVRQTPEEILIKPGGRAEMVCQHSRTDYRQMLWYKYSTENNLMDLIGNLYNSDATMEEPLGRDFKISGDLTGNTAKKSTLVIEDAGLKHSAIYFCAAREAL
ncbi:uncharacterized protein LOC128747579 [Synchiropus splendidus]|uniref:uncharacterized protein LOC128747579 n=1 Tax=Synchiropus splendidus TaxID=270530 RepID=UPI00237DC250|nr:uncharacterized protein LOC128747579 [Synchiropus splendidus]